MKKIAVLVLMMLLSSTLVACEEEELDYSDFDHLIYESHSDVEQVEEDFYVIYYYSETCAYCKQIKSDFLTFLEKDHGVSIYLMNSGDASDSSKFSEYSGTPTALVIQNGEVLETFSGTSGVKEFMEKFKDFDIDTYEPNSLPEGYKEFHHIYDFADYYTQSESEYIIYYYSEFCGYCNQIKDYMFAYATENAINIPVYFVNANSVLGTNPFPGTGTPTIFHVKNNEVYAQKSGSLSVPEYLTALAGETPLDVLDYSDFSAHELTTYASIYNASLNYHYAYVYSVQCGYCQNIKQEILTFFDELSGADFFLVDVAKTTDSPIPGLTGTPTLYLLNDRGEIIETMVGVVTIRDHIKDYEQGNVTYE